MFNFKFSLKITVLRFAKSHDMIESALKSIHLDDHFLRYTLTASNLNQAMYLILDNLLWLNSIGVIALKNKEKFLEYSNKFWLFSTILSLARDFYDLMNVIQNEDQLQKNNHNYNNVNKYMLDQTSGAYSSNVSNANKRLSLKRFLAKLLHIARLMCFNKINHPLLLDTLKNVFDLFLPLSSLNFVHISPGIQGLCGVMSSFISLIVIWSPQLKLRN